MRYEIKTISAPFAFGVAVNCYLIRAGNGTFLVDTGRNNKRKAIENELESAGCRLGSL